MEPRLIHDATAQAICGASAGLVALREIALQWRTRRTWHAASDQGTRLVTGAGAGIAILVASRAWHWAPGLSLSNGGLWPIVVGLVVFWAGAGLRWWAVSALGRFHQLTVVIQDDHVVVDRGPYRFVRHPSYAALIIGFVGVGLAYDNALGAVGAGLVMLLGLLPRIRVEERALEAALGQPYRDFARTRRRLIPGVW
jgi:protein-S-isoprenylcysteine O-methyltransferase Ste14